MQQMQAPQAAMMGPPQGMAMQPPPYQPYQQGPQAPPPQGPYGYSPPPAPPNKPGGGMIAALVVLGVLALGGITFGIVMATRKTEEPPLQTQQPQVPGTTVVNIPGLPSGFSVPGIPLTAPTATATTPTPAYTATATPHATSTATGTAHPTTTATTTSTAPTATTTAGRPGGPIRIGK
jgi:hypothetical protein